MAYKNFLETNLKSLEKTDSYLVNLIRNHKEDKENYLITETPQHGIFNLAVPKIKMLYYDPANILLSAQKDIENAGMKNPKIVLLLGFGLGYHLFKLITSPDFHKIKKIIVVEKDLNILIKGFSVMDFSEFFEKNPDKISFFPAVPENDLYSSFYHYYSARFSEKFYSKAVTIVPCGGALGLDKKYYMNAIKGFREGMFHSITDHGNSIEDSLEGLENTLYNMGHIIQNPGIKYLKNAFKDKPAIIVASGPSLNKNIEFLKKVGDKAIIFACDSSLGTLLRHGIKPHIVSTIERVLLMLKVYEGLDEYKDVLKDIYFADMPIIKKEVVDKAVIDYGMRHFIVFRDYLHFRWMKIERGEINCGKSVAHLLFKMAEYMGCNPIVLIGQDLSYGDNGETHEKGATYAAEIMEEESKDILSKDPNHVLYRDIMVKGNYKEKVRTSGLWHFFLRSFDTYAKNFKGTLINATEGGAYIENTQIMTLNEAIDKYMTEDIAPKQKMEELLSSFTHETALSEIETVKQIFEETLVFMDGCVEKCEKGVDLIKKFREELKEKTEGKNIPINQLDEEWLAIYSIEITDLKRNIVEPEMFRLYMLNNVQSYILKKEIDINSLESIYTNYNELRASYILIMSEWFDYMLQLSNICRDYLLKGKEQIEIAEKNITKS